MTSTALIPVPENGSLWLSPHFWLIGLMLYSFVASTVPVWLPLQPRDLINSHQLMAGLAFAISSVWVAIEGALAWRRASISTTGPVATPNGPR